MGADLWTPCLTPLVMTAHWSVGLKTQTSVNLAPELSSVVAWLQRDQADRKNRHEQSTARSIRLV